MRTSSPIRRRLQPRRTTALAATVVALTLTAGGCGADSPAGSDSEADATLSVEDPWVIAADEGMTAAFGTLRNDGGDDVVVTAVSSGAASDHELHETTMSEGSMVMREVEEGFVVPAGETMLLEPGGHHLMLMDLTDPLLPGEEVDFTLELEGGQTLDFSAQVREFSGADEEYEPSES